MSTQLFAEHHSSVLRKSGAHWVSMSGLIILQTLFLRTPIPWCYLQRGKRARDHVQLHMERQGTFQIPLLGDGTPTTILGFNLCRLVRKLLLLKFFQLHVLGPVPVNITKFQRNSLNNPSPSKCLVICVLYSELVLSPLHSPEIISPTKLWNTRLLNRTLCKLSSVIWAQGGELGEGGVRVNYIKSFWCSVPGVAMKYLDRGVGMKVGPGGSL